MAKKINVKGPIVDNSTGLIYRWIGFECCCPKDIENALLEADGEDVILEINSPGGYCDMGSEIYTMLKGYSGNTEAHIISAASAASVIACGADKVLISDTGMLMIHNAAAAASGDYRDMYSTGDALVEYNNAIINAYVRKTGKDREELQNMMDHTTWMSAEKAVELGFADDFLFGEINSSGEEEKEKPASEVTNLFTGMQAVNAVIPVIDKDKVLTLMTALHLGEQTEKVQNDSEHAISDIENSKKEGGKSDMTLEEFLESAPEAKKEFYELLSEAEQKGAEDENLRLKALDAIADSVKPEALVAAKYGESKTDAKTLAYEAMLDDAKRAKEYMPSAKKDAEESGASEVGADVSDPMEAEDESGEYAAYINRKKGK